MSAPFERFNAALAKCSPQFRCATEAHCESTAGDWALLALEAADRVDRLNDYDALDYGPKRRSPHHGTPQRTSTGADDSRKALPAAESRGQRDIEFSREDPLKRIPASQYLPVIAGVEVLASGRCRCPMPDHEDEHPSAKAYGTKWTCFACGAGGSVIDIAAAIYGIEPTGRGWFELRNLIIEALQGAPIYEGGHRA